MAEVNYGIESITFAELAPDGAFPDFEKAEAKKISINNIDIDSVESNEEENQSTKVEFENADSLMLGGTKGEKGFSFTSSDHSDEVLMFFRGMKQGSGDDEGWLVEDPSHDDSETLAMQVVTRALGEYPAKVKEYTPVLVTVKETGTIGKNNLGKLSYTCVRQPNIDATGKAIRGYREKSVKSA